METPYNENLLLSSASGVGGLATNVFGAYASAPAPAGTAQSIQHRFSADASANSWWWTPNISGSSPTRLTISTCCSTLADHLSHFLAEIQAGRRGRARFHHQLPRLSGLPEHGAHARALLRTGRRRPDFQLAGGRQRIPHRPRPGVRADHESALSIAHNGPWIDFTWRFDSGLVAGSVPDLAAALALTADEQAAMGFYCGNDYATHRARPREQFAGGFVIAEQDVGDAVALGAGQPCGDECIALSSTSLSRIMGRPENRITTTGMPAAFMLSIAATSSGARLKVAAVAVGLRHRASRRSPPRRRRRRPRPLPSAANVTLVLGETAFLMACQNGGAAGGHVAALALPVDGPAAALIAEVVGALAADVDALRGLRQRQHRARSSAAPATGARHRAPRRGAPASRTASTGCGRPAASGWVHQAHGELHAQNAPHGVVDARHRHRAILRQLPSGWR
jgi:hypothetical protein